MMTAIRIIPAPVKRLNGPDHIIPPYRRIENGRVLLQHVEPNTVKLSPQKVLDIQKQHHHEQFKNWCMPEVPDGYIKASRFDPL